MADGAPEPARVPGEEQQRSKMSKTSQRQNASLSVAQRKAPGVLRQRAFRFVFNVSLLLLNEIQDYFGLDYIAKQNVHRLKTVKK